MNEFGIIKSLDILKEIFKFLPEKRKLNIINYNYHLQEKLNIKIEDYKRVRGIYIEGERNGKGKEYLNIMIFEGEYLNRKRNGKGKEYLISDNIMIFEGEYVNRKRNGKGKEYYHNGKILFEGEYLNGERNGKGKEYYSDGKLEFEGEYLNGKKNGKGKKYYHNGKILFEGEYLNEKRWNGKGYNNEGMTDFEINEENGKGKEY